MFIPSSQSDEELIRWLGPPPAEDDLEGALAWFQRLTTIYSDMLKEARQNYAELFRVILEVPEAAQRYHEILRENNPQKTAAIMRRVREALDEHNRDREQAVARLLRDAGLSG